MSVKATSSTMTYMEEYQFKNPLKSYDWSTAISQIAKSPNIDQAIEAIPKEVFYYVLFNVLRINHEDADKILEGLLKRDEQMQSLSRAQIDGLVTPFQIDPNPNDMALDNVIANRIRLFLDTEYAERLSLDALEALNNDFLEKGIRSNRLDHLLVQKREELKQQRTSFFERLLK